MAQSQKPKLTPAGKDWFICGKNDPKSASTVSGNFPCCDWMHDVIAFTNIHFLFQWLLQLVQNCVWQKTTCQHSIPYTISCHMQTCTEQTCTCTLLLHLYLHLSIRAPVAFGLCRIHVCKNKNVWQENSACTHTPYAHLCASLCACSLTSGRLCEQWHD